MLEESVRASRLFRSTRDSGIAIALQQLVFPKHMGTQRFVYQSIMIPNCRAFTVDANYIYLEDLLLTHQI